MSRVGLPLAWFGLAAAPLAVPVVAPPGRRDYTAGPWRCAWSGERHRRAVAAVRARIAEGQTYQCNLTTRLTGPVRGELFGLYPDLGLESA